ncbi:MAG TPA: hypothetical protein VJ957_06120 [Longimicrobiales bacterium]|nr:hypothetical protein [Longimicrobiales bacterium]
MPHPAQQGALAFVCVLALAAAACSDAGPIVAPNGNLQRQDQPHVLFNPQPEPPALIMDYALTPDGGDWYGTVQVGGESCGTMQLIQTESDETGIVTHVGYELSITGANPDFQLNASLDGVVVRGHVVLNGRISSGFYAGQTIHPRGEIRTVGGGPVDRLTTLTGAVQLNPQPEPPSMAYPPSPCSG